MYIKHTIVSLRKHIYIYIYIYNYINYVYIIIIIRLPTLLNGAQYIYECRAKS